MGSPAAQAAFRAATVIDQAESDLFYAMALVFARKGYRELQLAIERQNRRIADLNRSDLEGEGWIL